ncbi:hypothetical protein K1T71_002491 [Dendrolimus kikuchii]|uniref:Uncharacterized protein n=1 Tax=Dendrolimus kikuchii TaxID=765133 RepID=A0ACC1DCV0_9NEOP|nr:hypothetical protein K1T71_002491 [Dendrolimus kikuchii]
MWFLIFVHVLFSASADASQNSLTFHKCCPETQSLIRISEDAELRYDCLDSEAVERKYNISYSPLIIGKSVNVHHGFPESCLNMQMSRLLTVEFDSHVSSDNSQCYEKLVVEVMNGTIKSNIPKIVSLACRDNETDLKTSKPVAIDQIRKCCPPKLRYDTVYHLCRKIDFETNEEWLTNQVYLNDSHIYEVETGIHCKTDEFGVELSATNYEFSMEGSTLHVRNKHDGTRHKVAQGEWCLERDYRSRGLVSRVCTRDCSAYQAYCLRKCCPLGEHFKTFRCGSLASRCVPNSDEVLFDVAPYVDPLKEKYQDIPELLGIRTDLLCPHGKVVLNRTSERDKHELTPNGLLVTPVNTGSDYCFEAFDERHCPGGGVIMDTVICFVKPLTNKNFFISFWMISISSVCLALTLLVYCALPELRNLHGRTLICHVTMMLLAFSCLARVQYDHVPNSVFCTMLGYGIYFGFVAAFVWLNVMCLDIWWTFGSVRTIQPLRKAGTERRRFLWYSLYAWSTSTLLTITMFLFDRYPVAKFLDPNIGHDRCWFGAVQNTQSDWPHYIFFVIPLGLVSCTNFILWVLTARHCARVKSEVHRLQAGSVGDRVKRRFRIDRAKYVLTGKLWVVMGAGWISELLSTLANSEPQWLWTVIDLLNELQGVFIFLILVFKPKLYYLIRKRLGLEKPDAQKNGASVSARTSSTFLSRTISTDERTNLRISHSNNVKLP